LITPRHPIGFETNQVRPRRKVKVPLKVVKMRKNFLNTMLRKIF